jgi:superfamily II DNA or RNA helicase
VTSWLSALEPDLVDRRFGAEAVNAALAADRVYVEPPVLDAGRLVAVVAEAKEKRLGSPYKVAVRLQGDVVDVACSCRHGRVCDHVLGLLVDVTFDAELREAILARHSPIEQLLGLSRARAKALEARTLDERLAAWLPPRRFDDDFEVDVDVTELPDGRSAVLLRHRRPGTRALVAARDVLAARLRPRRRNIVDLTSPYHLDRNALVATRGQASALVDLLRAEIGLYADGFKTRARFRQTPVAPRVDKVDDRLLARWHEAAGEPVASANAACVLVGPQAWLWASATHTFHPIDPSVDLDLALGLQRIPSLGVDATSAERVGRALLSRTRGLGVSMPEPEAFGLAPFEAPSFELRVTGSLLELRAELFAVYSAATVRVRVGDDEDGLDGRDAAAEDRALALVRDAGWAANALDPAVLEAEEDAAVRFWQAVPRLRAEESPRITILLGDHLTRPRFGPNDAFSDVVVDVRVGAETGWLDTELDFRAGALKVEMAHLHRVLASGRRWVVLADGELARIGDELAALVGEAAGVVGAAGTGRLPPHQFGRIARWIELADASGIALGTPSASRPALTVRLDETVRSLRERLFGQLRSPPPLPASVEASLRPYQRAGLAWLELLRTLGAGGVLADDMGLGKTLMTLALLAAWKESGKEGEPSLVVCPTSVVGNWLAEAARFTPSLRVASWHRERSVAALAEHDVLVTTYGVLRREAPVLAKRRFRCVVLDEAQNIKNAASSSARAARGLDAAMRIALTGTPIENRLSELWSIMSFANPGILGSAAAFDERYERPLAADPKAAVGAELRAIVRPFVLRRTKAEVLRDLPPKTEIERACVLGARQKRAYDALALALREAMAKNPDRRKGARTQLSVLTGILRLRQMACDPRLVDPEARATDSAKRVHFLDLVRELVSEGRRALVFSQFVELLSLWRQDLDEARVAYEYLDGSTVDRDAVVERFQQGTAPLFLVSLKAGGAGLNLTAADTVIHCDPWWNPAAEDQATDRAHRIGQEKPVTVVRLVARGTIEDKVALLKAKKSELARAILGVDAFGAEETSLGGLGEEELLELFGGVDGDADADELTADDPA